MSHDIILVEDSDLNCSWDFESKKRRFFSKMFCDICGTVLDANQVCVNCTQKEPIESNDEKQD